MGHLKRRHVRRRGHFVVASTIAGDNVRDPAMLKGVKVDFVEASYTETIAVNVVAGK